MKFWFLLLQWPLLLSDFKWGQSYITFWSEVIQGYLWGKMLKMRGLMPNQHWPTYFIGSSKKLMFATTYKFQRVLSRRNLEFLPWIKTIYCFQKKVLNFKVKIQEFSSGACNFQFFKLFEKVTPNILNFTWGLFYSLFFSHGFKRAFIEMLLHFLHIFGKKLLKMNYFLRDSQFWETADFLKIGIWDIAMTCTNIYLGQTLLKLLKLLGHTH